VDEMIDELGTVHIRAIERSKAILVLVSRDSDDEGIVLLIH
jgi:hypothetical protein